MSFYHFRINNKQAQQEEEEGVGGMVYLPLLTYLPALYRHRYISDIGMQEKRGRKKNERTCLHFFRLTYLLSIARSYCNNRLLGPKRRRRKAYYYRSVVILVDI